MDPLTTPPPAPGLGGFVPVVIEAGPSATLGSAPSMVNGVVVNDAPELTLADYAGPAGLGSSGTEFSTTTVVRVPPNGFAGILSDQLPVPGLQVVHT